MWRVIVKPTHLEQMQSSDIAKYKGFRYNWSDDSQVHYATTEDLGDIAGHAGVVEWNISDSLVGYNMALGSLDTFPDNALWGRRTGVSDEWQWSASINNAIHKGAVSGLDEYAGRDDFVLPILSDNHVDVMGGLILTDCNTIPNTDSGPDDYNIRITAQVEGWSQW